MTISQRRARRTATLILLMWFALPAGLIAWLFTGDWRWAVAGAVCFVFRSLYGKAFAEALKEGKTR